MATGLSLGPSPAATPRGAFLPEDSEVLLAVDLGLRTGLALYSREGKLCWYRSTNFGKAERLRRGAPRVLAAIPNPAYLVLEGGGALADIWEREAERQGLDLLRIDAQVWRQRLLLPRECYDRTRLKEKAETLARAVIDWSDAPRPTSLRHDAAEAILIGLWGVLEVGWLEELPGALRRR
ncbi:MAG TPA: hypothetical protein VES89_13275 [Candidatus Competibacteraceae bacterium]|nr:hypothetical protein [Candidatus Competibacteraceae bacterium]